MQFDKTLVDALTEMINIGVGRGASVLNTILQQHITLSVPSIKIIRAKDIFETLQDQMDEQISGVKLKFWKDFSGTGHIVFPSESVPTIISALLGEEATHDDIDSIRTGTLSEVGNIVLNSVIGTMSNLLKINLEYSLPSYFEKKYGDLFSVDEKSLDSVIILAQTRFEIKDLLVSGNIILIFEMDSFDRLLSHIKD